FGVAGLIVSRDRITCVTNTIESPRIAQEELVGIDLIDYPWYDDSVATSTIGELIGSKKIAADHDPFDLHLPRLPADFCTLRWQLCPEEIERYRVGGRLASQAMEAACRK